MKKALTLALAFGITFSSFGTTVTQAEQKEQPKIHMEEKKEVRYIDGEMYVDKTKYINGVEVVWTLPEDEPITDEMYRQASNHVTSQQLGLPIDAVDGNKAEIGAQSTEIASEPIDEPLEVPAIDEPQYVEQTGGSGTQWGPTRYKSYSTLDVAAIKTSLYFMTEGIAYAAVSGTKLSDKAKAAVYLTAGGAATFMSDFVGTEYVVSKFYKYWSSYYNRYLYDSYYNVYDDGYGYDLRTVRITYKLIYRDAMIKSLAERF